MKKIVLLAVVILFSQFLPAQNNSGIEQFKWLTGQWKGEMDGGVLYEKWTQHNNTTLLGEGYFVTVDGDTVLRETLRIEKIGNYWCYIPIINNASPVLFVLTTTDNKEWKFTNPEHDFPQMVAYSQQKDGSLLAWIEGKVKGEQKKEEYRMKKVK